MALANFHNDDDVRVFLLSHKAGAQVGGACLVFAPAGRQALRSASTPRLLHLPASNASIPPTRPGPDARACKSRHPAGASAGAGH